MTVRTGTPEVYGLRETMADLRNLDKVLYKESMKQIKQSARPLQQEAKSRLPGDPPLSGMARGRLSWDAPRATTVSILFGGRVSRSKGTWDLVKMRLAGAGGSLFDMAGRGSGGSTPAGQALIRNLNKRFTGASRAMWPAYEAKKDVVNKAVLDAARDASKIVNKELLTTPTGRWI